MTLTLRDYQEEAVESIPRYYDAGGRGNALIVCPTSGGKSLIMAEFLRRTLTRWPDQRILVVTHVKELIAQNAMELQRLWPTAPLGIYSAGLKRRDTRSRILFCGIQSVWKRVREIQWADLILVDEAHLIPRADGAMYMKFIEALRSINPHLKVIGLTATPFRLDSGRLTRGTDAMFEGIAYDIRIRTLIEGGYLVPLRSKATDAQLDVSGVGMRGGEFIPGELERACDVDEKTQAIVEETLQRAASRRAWLVFAAGVKHAEHLAEAFRARGVTAECVFGETPPMMRDDTIARFKAGQIRALVNVGVLTTGFNAPITDALILARPTKSPGLLIQICGRGMRCNGANLEESVANSKADCLVLDFARNIERHGPVDLIDGDRDEPGESDGQAPAKTCPECREIVAIAVRVCPACGWEFPPPPPPAEKLTPKPSAAPVMSFVQEPELATVDAVYYSRHEKRGVPVGSSPPTLRVDYLCGLTRHQEWVCLEHPIGRARASAGTWWLKRGGDLPVPKSIAEALSRKHELQEVLRIAVVPDGRYSRVVNVELGERPPAPEPVAVTVTVHAPQSVEEEEDDVCPF